MIGAILGSVIGGVASKFVGGAIGGSLGKAFGGIAGSLVSKLFGGGQKSNLQSLANGMSRQASQQNTIQAAPRQENAAQLMDRVNNALATNAGPEEWKNIGQEAQDRIDQMELQGRPRRKGIKGVIKRARYDAEMAQLNKIIDLADKRSAGATDTTGTTDTTSSTNSTSTTDTSSSTNSTSSSDTSSSTSSSSSTTSSTSNRCNSNFNTTAGSLNDLINEAKHAYTGNDPEIKNALSNIEDLDDQLQRAINEGRPPEEIKALATKLSNALDKLGNKFPADSKMAEILGKAEAAADKLIGEADSAIQTTADKLNDKINESRHAYVGEMPQDIKDAYADLEAADDKLQTAIAQGKSSEEIRKLAIDVSNLADKLGNKLAADPAQTKAAEAMKAAEGLAEKLISENSGTTTSPETPENPSTRESAINVDQDAKTIRIDADKDGTDDYEIKMMGKSQAWEVTQLSTGEKFKVWGDPHVDLNSQNNDGTTKDFDFKNTSTFVLPGVNGSDDVKITAGTTQYKNTNKTVTDTLTITTGDDAVKVTGVANNQVKIGSVTNDGDAVDAATNDGHIFRTGDHINDMQILTEDGTFEDADQEGTDMHAEGEKIYEYNG